MVSVFDSWGRWPSGLFSGLRTDFGHFDQCWKSSFKTIDPAHKSSIYCHLPLQRVPLTLKGNTVKLGICVPSSCSSEDLSVIFIKTFFTSKYLRVNPLAGFICIKHSENEINFTQKLGLLVLMVTVTIIAFSTYIDVTKKVSTAWILPFSLKNNIKTLMSVNESRSRISCLDGLRCLAMFSIVTAHMLQIHEPHYAIYNELQQRQVNSRFGKLDLGVDTFFVISGVTLAYQFLKERERG